MTTLSAPAAVRSDAELAAALENLDPTGDLLGADGSALVAAAATRLRGFDVGPAVAAPGSGALDSSQRARLAELEATVAALAAQRDALVAAIEDFFARHPGRAHAATR